MSYAVTLTLKPILYKKSIEDQYDLLYLELRDICHNKHNLQHTFVVELTKACNIHAHGVLRYGDKASPYVKRAIHDLFRKSKIIGFVYVKPVDDLAKWLEYMLKEHKQTRESLNCRQPVLTDQLNIIPDEINFQHILETPVSSSTS